MYTVRALVTISVWLVVTTADHQVIQRMTATGDFENHPFSKAELHFGNKKKRSLYQLKAGSIMGNTAVKFLLRGARQILSDDKYKRMFEKPGSYRTAVKEFWSIKPTDVSTFKSGKDKGMFGKVGDRVIMVESRGKTGLPTMKIMRNFGTAKEGTDEIIYKSLCSTWVSKWTNIE